MGFFNLAPATPKYNTIKYQMPHVKTPYYCTYYFELKSMAYMNVAHNLHTILFKIFLKFICWMSKLRDIANIECLPYARWSATNLDTIQVLQVLFSLLNQHKKKANHTLTTTYNT